MLEIYLPIIIMLVLGFGFAGLFLFLSAYLGARRATPLKTTVYESGMESVGSARDRFSIKFYMVAVSFIVFDIEVVFLYPYAIQVVELGLVPFVAVTTCIVVLFLGYFYELKKGGFKWD
jgi:NADH-quinone oxidoreductase subunit A